MNEPMIEKALAAAQTKISMLHDNFSAYMMRSVLAGLYLSLICFLFWALKNDLASSPFGNLVAALFFGVGLFVIIITRAELFTSNAFYMATSFLNRETSLANGLKLWVFCYVGNLIGALLMAGLLYGAGGLDGLPADHALFAGAEHKVHYAASVIFFKGILANWIVCLAVWVAMHLKEEMAKFMSILLIISSFLYLGFEHSIANMGTFSFVLFAAEGHITVAEMGYNLLWATLGNIVGGAVLIGWVYAWLNDKSVNSSQSNSVAQKHQTQG